MKTRHRIAVICAGLLLLGETVWVLWPRGPEPASPPPGKVLARIAEPARAGRVADAPAFVPGPDEFTFQAGGQAERIDLSRARQCLERMVAREPAADAAPLAAGWPVTDASFLRWPQRTYVGTESIKMQKCRVIDFTNPVAAEAGGGPVMLTRLFVRVEDGALMRLQHYNREGKLATSFALNSWKRVPGGGVRAYEATAAFYVPGTKKVLGEQAYTALP